MSTAPATSAAAVDPLTAALGGTPAPAAPATPAPTPPTTPVAPPAAAATAAAAETKPAAPAAETKPAATATAPTPKRLLADDEAPAPAAAAPVAPVEEWKLDAPDAIKPEVEDITAWAKANKLTKDQAQSLVQTRATVIEKQIAKVNDQWHDAVMAHPEFGGDKLPQTQEAMKRGLLALIPDVAERKALVNSPFINHPTMVRLLTAAAKLLPKEDRVHSGAQAANNYPITLAEAIKTIYGDR